MSEIKSTKDGPEKNRNFFTGNNFSRLNLYLDGKNETAAGNASGFNKTISYKPVGTDSQKIVLPSKLPLICFQQKASAWSQVPLPKKSVISIDDSRDSDVKLSPAGDQETNILIKEYGNMWFILNVNRKNEMRINGLVKNQFALYPDSSCFLQCGVDQFIFVAKKKSTADSEGGEEPDNQPRKVSQHAYSLEFKGKQYPIPATNSALIGMNGCNDLRVKGAEFEGIVFPRQNALYFFPLASQGVNIMEAPVSAATPIRDGTVLAKDNVKITVTVPEELSENVDREPSKNFSLIQLNDHGNIARIILLPPADRSANLGRTDNNDIVIKHHRISRTHAQFIVYDNSILLMDSHSTNGTYFNGQQINRKRCYPGDVISFADQEFIIGYAD